MEVTTFLEIDLRRQGIVPILEAVQCDTGRTVKCYMSGITEGAKSARVYCIKPSGKETYTEGKIVNENCIVFEIKKQMIAEEGTAICQLHLMDGEEVITSFEFGIKVKKNRIAESNITSSDDYEALIKLLAELEKYKELMITKEGHILSAEDKFGTSFEKNLLNISLTEELSPAHKRAYFSVTAENATTWKNLPSGFMRGNVVIGVREVFWRNTAHVMVKVTELFPDYGKQYINLYNNGKWGQWIVKSDDRIGMHILTADDIVGNNFDKNFLMVSLQDKFSSKNKRAYFSIKQSEFSSWANIPPGMKQGEATIIGVRDVYWRNSGCALVKVTEFYPSAGKQYLNMYNADKWMGWQTVHTEKNSVTKTMMANQQVNSTQLVPTSAIVYSMNQSLINVEKGLGALSIGFSTGTVNGEAVNGVRGGYVIVGEWVFVDVKFNLTNSYKDTVILRGLPVPENDKTALNAANLSATRTAFGIIKSNGDLEWHDSQQPAKGNECSISGVYKKV